MAKDCEVSRKHTCRKCGNRGHMEVCCRTTQDKKYPQVFTGLGKLKHFQLKLHVDESVTPAAQAMRRIPYSRRQKAVDKLEELTALDVIEKVNGPTSWINPLVVV